MWIDLTVNVLYGATSFRASVTFLWRFLLFYSSHQSSCIYVSLKLTLSRLVQHLPRSLMHWPLNSPKHRHLHSPEHLAWHNLSHRYLHSPEHRYLHSPEHRHLRKPQLLRPARQTHPYTKSIFSAVQARKQKPGRDRPSKPTRSRTMTGPYDWPSWTRRPNVTGRQCRKKWPGFWAVKNEPSSSSRWRIERLKKTSNWSGNIFYLTRQLQRLISRGPNTGVVAI